MGFEIVMLCNRPALRKTPKGRTLEDSPGKGKVRSWLAFSKAAIESRGEAKHRASKEHIKKLKGQKFAELKQKKKIVLTAQELAELAKQAADKGTSLSELSQYYDFVLKLEKIKEIEALKTL